MRLAYRFYENERIDGELCVMCFSWLLYPPILENYKDGTNIKKFYRLFDVVKFDDDAKNKDFWRVFKVRYSPEELDKVETDNSLKRAIAEHLRCGGTMGNGTGIVVVDEDF